MDVPSFKLSEVARAADLEANTLRSWLQRGYWKLDQTVGDNLAEVHGKAHLVTLRRALHIGAAADLIRSGVDPSRAFRAARAFVYDFDPLAERGGHPRGPGGLYVEGWTLLVAYPDNSKGVITWVDDGRPRKEPTKSKDKKYARYPAIDALRALFFPPFSGLDESTGTFVWLNKVDARIRMRLPGAND